MAKKQTGGAATITAALEELETRSARQAAVIGAYYGAGCQVAELANQHGVRPAAIEEAMRQGLLQLVDILTDGGMTDWCAEAQAAAMEGDAIAAEQAEAGEGTE